MNRIIECELISQPSVFVCSKPLQVINCLSIIRYYKICKPVLIIVKKNFQGYNYFIDFISECELLYLSVAFNVVDNHFEACEVIKGLNYRSIFIEDDRTSFTYLFATLKKDQLIVFEEGVSTYYSSYRYKMNIFRKLKWLLLAPITKSGIQFGQGEFTDFVMVSYPYYFGEINNKISRKALYFPGLMHEIRYVKKPWLDLVYEDLITVKPGYNVALIIGTWGGGECSIEMVRNIQSSFDATFFKPHPHDGSAWGAEQKIVIIDKPWIPSEVYILALIELSVNITVYHYSSSTFFYCINDTSMKNVKFVDLGSDKYVKKIYKDIQSIEST
ncbi:hypothetical protein GCM10008094_30920 [Aidingimonas halophila]|nr:hypothetical protein GCM10008094_30920 [Aidingimonas halophila]